MANNYFKFKQFTIQHNNCAMKVGTDGVLLGAWAEVKNVNTILDIGTGSGLITLMLAQRSKANISAIEIDKDAFIQAKQNIENCKWNNRIKVENISFQKFTQTTDNKFDLIVCNPPFFENSLLNTDNKKSLARHNIALTYTELIVRASSILNEKGKLSIIFPYSDFKSILKIAKSSNLFLNRLTKVKPNKNKEIKRVLCEFSFQETMLSENILIIEKDKRHQYSNDYISLCKDFYLKF